MNLRASWSLLGSEHDCVVFYTKDAPQIFWHRRAIFRGFVDCGYTLNEVAEAGFALLREGVIGEYTVVDLELSLNPDGWFDTRQYLAL